jgi:hypothetical protein
VDNRVEAVKKLMETTGRNPGIPTVEEPGEKPIIVVSDRQLELWHQDRSGVAQRISLEDIVRFLVTYRFPIILWILLVLSILVVLILLNNKPWRYERECEHPDENTVGQVIQRSNASAEMAHGQFGTVPAWPAQSGYVEYDKIRTPWASHLYLQLRYSKFSASEVPILVFLDDEERASIMPIDQGDWDKFVWTETIDLGKVGFGVHSIKFYTDGQIYGVADLDKFILTTEPP